MKYTFTFFQVGHMLIKMTVNILKNYNGTAIYSQT